jgi:hypothetical protein
MKEMCGFAGGAGVDKRWESCRPIWNDRENESSHKRTGALEPERAPHGEFARK